jgi:hypothetical protein
MGRKNRVQRNENKEEIENTYEESGNVKQGRNSSKTEGINRSHPLVQEVLNVASQIVPSQMDTVNKVVDSAIVLASTYETPLTSTKVFEEKDEYAKYEALEDHQDEITAKQIKQEKSRKKKKTKKTFIEPEYSSDSDPKPKSNTGSDPKPKSNTGSATTDQVDTLKEIIFFGKMYLIHFLIIILLASITSYGLLIGIITNLLFPVFLLIVDLLIYRFVRKW